MKLANILENYVTKDNEQIHMERIDDSEGDNNRGWQVDKIDAYVGSENVGYIKLSYIPRERWDERYKGDMFNFWSSIAGKHILPYNKDGGKTNLEELSVKELQEAIINCMLYGYSLGVSITEFVPEEHRDHNSFQKYISSIDDKNELLTVLHSFHEEALKHHSKKSKKGMLRTKKDYEDYFVDKPIVDYITSHKRRLRIGLSLYLEAAKWMKEKGMKLYASGIQSDDAKRVWEYLKQNYTVKMDGIRKFLDI